ncbi:exodeoxyribonuclease VII large subunit [Desulfatibacillum aliphaticivorans]|nr:exodeoxyribonuclease VII large subunit [Desulfatibacillum aliphaticivorans]
MFYTYPMNPAQHTQKRRIHTVSQLTAIIKSVLEEALPFVWVTGEISNLHIPSSGHYYFTLKDDHAQIRSVMFKGHARNLKFDLEDGMSVVCLGRVAVYEPQGAYQVLVEHMEPAGMGALALAFEQLKAKLSEEGLFDEDHKKSLPYLPRTIAVVTSPTGAVIHDILRVLSYRFPKVHVQVWPVKVQGADSPAQIVRSLEMINQQNQADVVIIARGGGSLEDLAPFNSEEVARAIFASAIPVISAVGHETDYTIADYTADRRAPTPSAAAEIVLPEYQGLELLLKEYAARLKGAFTLMLKKERDNLLNLKKRLPPPRRQVDDWRLRMDDYQQRIINLTKRGVVENRNNLSTALYKLNNLSPLHKTPSLKVMLELKLRQFTGAMQQQMRADKAALSQARASLEALNPSAILERGYSITRKTPGMEIVRNVHDLSPGDEVEITLASGKAAAQIKSIEKGTKS